MSDSPPPILSRAESRFSFYSGQASTVCRTLALSAIAIAWLFVARGGSGADLGPEASLQLLRSNSHLLRVINFAIWFLIFDAAQYAISAVLWAVHRWTIERLVSTDGFDPSAAEYVVYAVADVFGTVRFLQRNAAIRSGPRYRSLATAIVASRSDPTSELAKLFEEPLVPSFIPRITIACFLAKLYCLVVCYAALRGFVNS